jgi:hypothetical protein
MLVILTASRARSARVGRACRRRTRCTRSVRRPRARPPRGTKALPRSRPAAHGGIDLAPSGWTPAHQLPVGFQKSARACDLQGSAARHDRGRVSTAALPDLQPASELADTAPPRTASRTARRRSATAPPIGERPHRPLPEARRPRCASSAAPSLCVICHPRALIPARFSGPCRRHRSAKAPLAGFT